MKIRRFTGTDTGSDDSAATCSAPRQASLRTLGEQVPVAGLDVIADGGVYAVIGPTGVGKTTSIAKLAVRAALQFGPGTVGLVSTLIALPANTASRAMQEIVDAFRTAQPAGCILTKTDEATSLGGALSVLIRSGLSLAYVANGQRVPEDLHLMRNRQTWLAKMAVELIRRDSRVIDAETLARNFSEVATHANA